MEFPSVGYYRVSINCSNHISAQDDLTFDVEVVEEIFEQSVSTDAPVFPFVPLSSAVNLEVSMTNGSNVSCIITPGDASAASAALPFPATTAWSAPLQYTHTYTTEGVVSASVSCTNSLGTTPTTVDLEVVVPINTLSIITSPISTQSIALSVRPEAGIASNSPPHFMNCTFDYGDGTSEPALSINTTGLTEPLNQGLTTVWHWFDSSIIGLQNISVTCSNVASELTEFVVIDIRQGIQNLAASVVPPGNTTVAVETDVLMNISITAGSSVTINVTCDTAAAAAATIQTIPLASGELHTSAACNYSVAGTYSVSIIADNGVSTGTVTMTITALIPVTTLTVTTDSPSRNPPGDLVVTLTIPTPYPTDPSLELDLDGDGLNDTYEMVAVFTTGSYVYNYNYGNTSLFGDLVLTATLWNALSSTTSTTVIQVMHELVEFGVTVQSFDIPALTPVSFLLFLTDGTHIDFLLDFGDGTNETQYFENFQGGRVDYHVEHTYNQTGDVDIVIIASNAFYPITGRGVATIHWPLRREDLEFIHPDVVVAQDNTARLLINHIGTWPVPENVELTVTYPFGIPPGVYPNLQFPITAALLYWLSDTFGEVTTSISLTNIATTVAENFTFLLTERIEGEAVTGPTILCSDEIGMFVIGVVKGWNVSTTVSFGDGSPPVEFQGKLGVFNHTYATGGIRSVTALFTNDVSNASVVFTVDVREKVNVTMLTNAPVKLPQDLNLTFVTAPGSPQAVLSFSIEWGDGDTTILNSEVITNGRYELLHPYPVGSYVLSVLVDNVCSNQAFTEVIHADVPVTGLNFSISSLVNDTEEGVGIVYEPDVDVHFAATTTTCSRCNYTFILGDLMTVQEQAFTHVFTEDHILDTTVIAENFASIENITRKFYVASPVGLDVYFQPDKIYLVDNLQINMTFDFPKNICLHFQFKSGRKLLELWYETKVGMCATYDPEYDGVFNVRQLPWGNEFYLLPLFKRHGEYEEWLLMYTEVKKQKKIYELTVQEHACEPPTISTLEGPGKHIDNPRTVTVSDFTIVTSEDLAASTFCRETSLYITKWASYFLEDTTDMEVEPMVDVAGVDSEQKFYFQADARSLIPGYYKVELTILMRGLEQFNNSDVLFLRVIPTPLEVAIHPDHRRTVGNVRPIGVDALSVTFDLDVDPEDKSGLTFTWFCHRFDEVLIIPDDSANDGSIPIIQVPSAGKLQTRSIFLTRKNISCGQPSNQYDL